MPEKNWEGSFKFDDDMKKLWKRAAEKQSLLEAVDNTDELIDVLDMVADHRDAIEDGVQTLQVLHENGTLDRLQEAAGDTEAILSTLGDEPAEPVGLFGALKKFRDPAVQNGLGRIFALLAALGRTQGEEDDK